MNVLVVGIGNPGRGDDALGPLLVERLTSRRLPAGTELMTEFQLQIEHLLDLAGREAVVFVDASVCAGEPFDWQPVRARPTQGLTSHVLEPAELLAAYERHYGTVAPVAHALAIRGHGFDLGAGLSPRAAANGLAAEAFLEHWLAERARQASPQCPVRSRTPSGPRP